jgi:hypothetical protein
MKRIFHTVLASCTAALVSTIAWALPIDSGNTLALDYSSAKTPDQRKKIAEPVIGKLHYFRYLKILEMNDGMTNGNRVVFIKAVEPSSDMLIEFTVTKPVSLKTLDDDPKTKLGDAVGVQGRLESIGKVSTNTIVLNPVIVKHKDKLAPVRGKELLYEIDPNARYGTDTSGSKPVVIKRPK